MKYLKALGIIALLAIIVVLAIKFVWGIITFLLPIVLLGLIVWWIVKKIKKSEKKA